MIDSGIQYQFSPEKNQQLIQERNISFQEIIKIIDNGKLLNIIDHLNLQQYSHQQMYITNINNYIHGVPFVKKDNNTIFLRTIFLSRKLTKHYLTIRQTSDDSR